MVFDMDMELRHVAEDLAALLEEKGLRLATAESCTGGWVSKELTALAGSSTWYEGGVVSYSNAMKENLLHVPAGTIEQYGAVSEPVAVAMASGAASVLNCDLSLAITGIAGPSGGTSEKPVGTVWIGWSVNSQPFARHFLFAGDRAEVRRQAVHAALQGLIELVRLKF